jgi:hypothetical protein
MADVQTRGITFTEAVLRRPSMYTVNGTFAEVACFLEGYYSGTAKANYDVPPVVEWSAFRRWLADRFGVDSSVSFKSIQQSYNDDCERLKALADWYARFQSER